MVKLPFHPINGQTLDELKTFISSWRKKNEGKLDTA